MAEKKQALLLFCKPPVPGLVKTRLTIERGGFLSPEQAAELFRRCLYDVSEMCMQALLSMQADNDALVAELREIDPRLTLIAAGGINPENAAAYAATGVDGLATTAPFSAKPCDMSARMHAL